MSQVARRFSVASLLASLCRSGRPAPALCVLSTQDGEWRGALPDQAHIHEGWEIKILARGAIRWRSPAGDHHLRAPALLATPPHIVHAPIFFKDLTHPESLVVFLCEGRKLDLSTPFRAEPESLVLSGGQQRRLAQRLGASCACFLDSWGEVACPAQDKLRELQETCRSARALLLLAVLALISTEPNPSAAAGGNSIVAQACEYMERRYFDSGLTVQEVARAIGRTATHLATVFQAETGVGVRQTLVRLRLERAQRLLTHGTFSVKEVAHLTGWRTPQYFASCFHARFGHAPSRQA